MSDLRYLPLRPGTNVPAITDWPRLATNDRATILNWAAEFPGMNLGLLTGNGLGVLDIDTKSDVDEDGEPIGYGGFASLIQLEELVGVDLSNLPMVETYTGAHLYFRYHGHLQSKIPWLPHLDVKADGGHQVAAPGTVRDGKWGERVYRLTRGILDTLDTIPYAPESLITAIRSWRVAGAGGGSGGFGSSVDLPATDYLRENGFRLGQRDNGFNTLAWKLVRNHYPYLELITQIAREVWERTDNPDNDPLPWSKVQYQIDRAARVLGPEIDAQSAWAKNLRSTK